MNILDKDIYETILLKADNATIIQMLNAHVDFKPGDPFFKRLMEKKYPYLVNDKGDLSWRQFYIVTIYYIAKLKEKYDINYSKSNRSTPELIYNKIKSETFDGEEGNF
tara:strand:+ start:813 stop:1136 length:324 start_codon:yes stop_codon:yes gene_type:complete